MCVRLHPARKCVSVIQPSPLAKMWQPKTQLTPRLYQCSLKLQLFAELLHKNTFFPFGVPNELASEFMWQLCESQLYFFFSSSLSVLPAPHYTYFLIGWHDTRSAPFPWAYSVSVS